VFATLWSLFMGACLRQQANEFIEKMIAAVGTLLDHENWISMHACVYLLRAVIWEVPQDAQDCDMLPEGERPGEVWLRYRRVQEVIAENLPWIKGVALCDTPKLADNALLADFGRAYEGALEDEATFAGLFTTAARAYDGPVCCKFHGLALLEKMAKHAPQAVVEVYFWHFREVISTALEDPEQADGPTSSRRSAR
jgi:hypothetical protein